MKTRWLFSVLMCVGMLLPVAAAVGQDERTPKGQDAAQAQMEEAWEKAAMPNENHQRLGAMIGTWNCTVKTWEPGSTSPTESAGKCTNTWILGNRYVLTEYEGNFRGMPFEGMGIGGYDNINKRYFSTWFDTMMTGMMSEHGQYEGATKTYTYTGRFDAPMGKTMHTRSITKVVSHDEHHLTMYHGEDAHDLPKFMEITYRRATGRAAAETAGSATARLVARTVETGCGHCTYHMDGVRSCRLAVKIDGKPYLVTGADVSVGKARLCGVTKKAEVTGTVKDDTLVATSFKLKP